MALFFNLIISTIVSCSHYISSPVKQILARLACSGETAEEKLLLSEVSSLRRSLQGVSMADQFAAWAKLQRQINALTQKYQAKASERYKQEQFLRRVCGVVVDAVIWMLTLWYVWCSRGSAVAALPQHLLTPLGSVLAVPSCQPGEISVVVWMACVRSVVSHLRSNFFSKRITAAPLT
ncbi:WRB/Get1 family [Trinorchestia longiramus]|nr:WRB/Get1 family [Trinorchestia longiramus]